MIAGHTTSQVRAFVERRERSGRGHRRQWSCARVYARGCGGCTSGRAEGCATRERGARGDGQNKSMFSDKGSYAFRRRLTSCPPLRQAHLDIARLSISARPPEAKRQDKTFRTKRKLKYRRELGPRTRRGGRRCRGLSSRYQARSCKALLRTPS